ncbi:MAG: hypothetical protein SF028_05910 [Candidatus Sumerlaeia bacterium]|nr:hypothetical protein [Candidatus Sumerlaeia bacterium]
MNIRRAAAVSAACLLAFAVCGHAQERARPEPAPAQAPKAPPEYRRVRLEKLPAVRLEPSDGAPLERGRPMRFRVVLESAPSPVTMATLRIEATAGALAHPVVVACPDRTARIEVSKGAPLADGRDTFLVAAVLPAGVAKGTLLELEFTVAEDAPDSVALALSDHPHFKERLVHDGVEGSVDYERRLDDAPVRALPVVDSGPAKAARWPAASWKPAAKAATPRR